MKRAGVKPVSGGGPTRRCKACGEFYVVFDYDVKVCPDCDGEHEEQPPDVFEVMQKRGRR
jgi:rRNA maturation endonuclease Nob1